MSPALTAEQIAKGQKTGNAPAADGENGNRTVQVDPPSNSYRVAQPD
jgi:hypothetical protein